MKAFQHLKQRFILSFLIKVILAQGKLNIIKKYSLEIEGTESVVAPHRHYSSVFIFFKHSIAWRACSLIQKFAPNFYQVKIQRSLIKTQIICII